jgi:hypothetical protein
MIAAAMGLTIAMPACGPAGPDAGGPGTGERSTAAAVIDVDAVPRLVAVEE